MCIFSYGYQPYKVCHNIVTVFSQPNNVTICVHVDVPIFLHAYPFMVQQSYCQLDVCTTCIPLYALNLPPSLPPHEQAMWFFVWPHNLLYMLLLDSSLGASKLTSHVWTSLFACMLTIVVAQSVRWFSSIITYINVLNVYSICNGRTNNGYCASCMCIVCNMAAWECKWAPFGCLAMVVRWQNDGGGCVYGIMWEDGQMRFEVRWMGWRCVCVWLDVSE